ncbi:salicylic acid-binding protein 2-like [Durio zibethinus]|uniref:Salicylic acid-binding protein 2-like n=1 Tax=Durio zibethinus TaxID=66656 RepID=A0A6P5YL89_DURZI|nr:salicylic acid-binding protein 2-like [Durio zibethinus]XP_022741279.1 salicylic acid-binding protein 2-like [Durio zibethinus]
MAEVKRQKHFILVHGACHGAWSWYKLKPRLESAGYHVTAIDLAASGINMNAIQGVYSMYEYTKPLLEVLASLPSGEKVILVGHSLGGLNLALAMDKFPEKISAGVFLTAFMPDTAHQPSFVLEQYCERTPAEAWLDTQFAPYGRPEQSLMSMFFGPQFLKFKLYQLSPTEDLELAKVMIRPGSLFVSDLSKADKFSNERYGCVPRVYVVCNEDEGIPEKFQRWMIENFEVNDVMEIKDADHMAMFSKPQEVCNCLSKIAQKYG